ncbi:MAG: uncharacterized 2Fe-2S/4Fe-4S cluster protein (DUF4445 family) [Granulosicoccus sp.]|jgi:uncharacterized 2Fe-2S/4Fe-4S cluster protein (DUF4445 family)
MLQKVMDVPDAELVEVQLCGGFGNFIDLDSAARIRLLPKFDGDRISYIGSAALIEAEMTLLSESERLSAETIASNIEHVAPPSQLPIYLC